MRIPHALAALLAVLICAIGATTASAADLHATPANFASQFAAANSGDRVLLASGSYGAFNGGTKSGMVTIDEESGASATFSGGDYSTAVRNITIRNVTYTGSICVHPPSGVKMNLIFDGITMGNVPEGCGEGRMSIRDGGVQAIDGNGVQIKNSKFGPGGCSDGIQDLSNGTEIGPGNEFTGIVQGGCSQHADAIQPYASNWTHIHDNYMHDNEQGIMSPDGPADHYLFENNVISTTNAYPCITVGYGRNGTIRHNVCINGNIRVYGGNQNTNSQNMVVQDNSPGVNVTACTGCTVDHNQQVTYVGTPANTRCAYATASPKGTASDGTDIGLNDCGGSPPPPADADGDGVPDSSDNCPGTPPGTPVDSVGCPFGPPPTDHQPVASFTDTPDPSAPQQTVTFNGTASTCDDTPCTYHWHDIGADGTQNWPLGPDGSTMSFAFQGTGTKYVELVVTDADGDVDKVMHPHEVSNTPPPPADTTPPNTTITSAPSDSQSTSASVSFTGTDDTGVDHFDCKLDAGAYASCTSPKAYTGLSVGSHTVTVVAVDAAGNVDPTPATATWTVQAPPTSGPPTFVAAAQTSWTSSTSPKSATVAVQPGDVLVAYEGAEDSGSFGISSNYAGVSWLSRQNHPGDSGHSAATVWTATVPAGAPASLTVSFTRSGTSGYFGGAVQVWRGSGGVGVSGKAVGSGAPSLTLAGVSANSALVKFNVDWSAKDGTSRNSRTVGTFTETSYARDSARYTIYAGYHTNIGAAGSKTIGYTAPTGQAYTLLGVEVKGT